MLNNDIDEAITFLNKNLPWWDSLPEGRQRVMINLAFNMEHKLLGFPVFLRYMQRCDWANAAIALEDSKWFGQVGVRGPHMVQRVKGETAGV